LLTPGSGVPYAHLAASFQRVLELAVLALARELARRVPSTRLCFTGALARNRGLVAELAAVGPFAEIFVPAWCDDSGSAIGAALHAHTILAAGDRPSASVDTRLGEDALLEPVPAKISGATAEIVPDESERIERLAAALRSGCTVGWVRGRVEYGAGALGSRLVLADPEHKASAAHVARSVLRREDFAPCSALIAAERAEEFFYINPSLRRTAGVRLVSAGVQTPAREHASAIVTDRGGAFVQLVDAARDPALHRLLTMTSAPVLLALPLAPRGEPVVRGERDAAALFERSALDLLVVEDRIYSRP
jgi:carbamoyltransferase